MNEKRIGIVYAVGVLFFLFSMGLCNTVLADTWRTEKVDAPKYVTSMSSRAIALEKGTDYPHAVYGGDHLYHALFNGTSWSYETVDASDQVGGWPQ